MLAGPPIFRSHSIRSVSLEERPGSTIERYLSLRRLKSESQRIYQADPSCRVNEAYTSLNKEGSQSQQCRRRLDGLSKMCTFFYLRQYGHNVLRFQEKCQLREGEAVGGRTKLDIKKV